MATKAKESRQILKARQKIQKQLEEADKFTTAEALKTMSKIIQHQLARKKTDRINLKSRSIVLFDENQHPAKTESKFVSRLLKQLSKQSTASKSDQQLEGRIKSIHEQS